MTVFDPHTMPEERRYELRDCIHGRHARKCQECDLVIMEDEHRHMANALCEIADIDPGEGPPVEFLVDEALAVHRALLAEVAELRASLREKKETIDRMVREVAES